MICLYISQKSSYNYDFNLMPNFFYIKTLNSCKEYNFLGTLKMFLQNKASLFKKEKASSEI